MTDVFVGPGSNMDADTQAVRVQLSLDDLRIAVHLGVTAAEREASQEVTLALQLQFARVPGACNNDRIDATVDYAVLCASITQLLQAQSWQTIEYMAHCALRHVVGLVSQQAGIDVAVVELAVRKFPQVPGLDGGAQVRLYQRLDQQP